MNAIILSVGDELVLGQTIDTNSAWLSQQLASVGCDILAHQTVPDDQKAIADAIRATAGTCDFLLISGGIGPTADDLTRQALAEVMGVSLELNEQWLVKLKDFFQSRGREMPAMNQIQAMIPAGATMIENTCGTAAGIHAELPNPKSAIQNPKCRIFVMPGVPKEMKAMFQRDVVPHIQSAGGGGVILSRTLHTFGLGESAVAEKLGEQGGLMMRQKNPSVGTTVSNGIVSLRINARYPSRDEATQQIDATTDQCRAALGDLIFGSDDDTLPAVVLDLLKQQSQAAGRERKPFTVSTAESCTGGLLSKMLTDIAGSSDFFKQGWITYSNQSKIDRLGVSQNVNGLNGAVSEPVVSAMASAAKRLSKSDFALAISGIAGPGGGTEAKPVGTVCIALAHPQGEQLRTFLFSGDREMIRDRAAKMALTMLRFHLLGCAMPF